MFTREEVLGGLSGRRARVLLFLIESRTARLAARAWEFPSLDLAPEMGVRNPALVADRAPAGDASDEAESLLAPFGQGRDRLPPPTIREIERYAREWAPLVPEDPRVRATVARLLGRKYRFTRATVPGIRASLGLDGSAVHSAYEGLYRESLEGIFAPRVTAAERLRWAMAAFGKWLDALPPFWFVFAYILALGVPQAILALPIAVAAVGALPGIALILLGGLLSLVTVVGIAEASARSGTVRYGSAYFGKLVSDYLGRAGSASFTPFLLALYLLAVLACLEGLSLTLAAFTPVPTEVWTLVVFAGGLYAVARGSVRFSFGVSVALAGFVLGLLGLVMLLSLGHLRAANLLYSPLTVARSRPPGLENVLGVVLMGYIAEAFVVQCAKAVLPRDPSGRALIRGSVAALATIALLLCVWVLVISGSLPPGALAGQRGTVFVPLAAVAGPGVAVIGSLVTTLLLGLVALRGMIGSFNAVREWLPVPPRRVLLLPRGHGRLVLRRRGGPAVQPGVGVVYLGQDGTATRFRLDIQSDAGLRHVETCAADRWDVAQLFPRFPELRRHRLHFSLEVLEADEENARLLITGAPGLTCEVERAGLRLPDLMDLPDDGVQLLNWLLRWGEADVDEVAAGIGRPSADVRRALEALAEKGLVERLNEESAPRYQARVATRRLRRLPDHLWQMLEGSTEHGARSTQRRCRAERLAVGPTSPVLAACSVLRAPRCLSERARFLISIAPLVAVLLLTEWRLLTGRGSFAGALGFLGVIANAYATGVVPLLLLIACRRKGEVVPGTVLRFVGHPVLVAGLYVLYLGILLFHGLVLWQTPWTRAGGLLTAALMVGATAVMARRGAFAPRAVVELREELRQGAHSLFSLMADGQPVAADVRMEYPDNAREEHAASGVVPAFPSLCGITFCLPSTAARELKIRTHRVTPEGDSEPLAALAELQCGDETRRVDLGLCGGQVLLPIPCGACRVRITLPQAVDA
jgi:hypothetical protein